MIKEDYNYYKNLSSNVCFPFSYNLLSRNPRLFDWQKISINPGLIKLEKHEIHRLENLYWLPRDYSSKLLPHLSLTALNKNEVSVLNCVCCNRNYFWKSFEEDLIKEKCDFWLISRFGKIENSLIEIFQEELNEEKITGTKYTKFSDFTDSHPIYRNGWLNYFENENTIIDNHFVKNFFSKEIEVTRHNGNAMLGHLPTSKKIFGGNFFNRYKKFDISLDVLSHNYNFFPESLINETFIDSTIYEKIISPCLVQDNSLLNLLVEYFFHIDDRFRLTFDNN